MPVHFVTGRMDDCASPACLWGQYSLGGKGDRRRITGHRCYRG